MNIIRDASLAKSGKDKIAWVTSYMPVLAGLSREFAQTKPFAGLRIAMSIHLEAKTARFALALAEGGAEVAVTGCNPLSTQDDVAAGLSDCGISVYAFWNANETEYNTHLTRTLAFHPHLVLDDGGDLTSLLHGDGALYGDNLIGITEETTTGVHRAQARAREGQLRFPLVAVNDADCKHLFDNRYGTGQSVWEAVMRTTNVQITGKTVVVAGYGWCGRGVAMRAAGLGARVVVTEIDPVKAIEAVMDGFAVMPMQEAAPLGDIFITVTGCNKVITKEHMRRMKDGAILANAGHFDVEVDIHDLAELSARAEIRKPGVTGYVLADGRTINLLAAGRLVNLASGDGHPAEIMDMSFSVQALALQYLAQEGRALAPAVYPIPQRIDDAVSTRKLASMGVAIDALTDEQAAYIRQF